MSEGHRIGDSVNHYKIVSKLGKGGMGEVFLAEDTKLERRVALKILLAEVASDETRVRRFIQEAKAASALNHPNILTVHEIGSFDGSQYIVTEYIKGETLRDRLSAGAMSLRESLDVTMQVAAALSAAHNAGIVHRDIKPENIMIRDDGIAKVLDFGLVKLTEKKRKVADSKDETRVKTDPGMVMGTANYMSPEQARGKETDARTDVWSLGVVLYEMLAGETPFAGETANDSIAGILTKEPPTLGPGIPHELHRYVRRALQKNPDERYQTIKDFLHDVQDLKRELEISEEIERSYIPPMSRSTNVGITHSDENITAMQLEAISTQNSIAHQPSSAEYIVSEIKQHKRGAIGVLGVLLIGLVGAGAYFFWFAKPTSAAITSVAVLPFENGSGDPNLDYLSDGLSASLIDKLSELPQLKKVIARSSSFKYRGPNPDVQEIAAKLGVQAIVMGKVGKIGDQLSVRVELVDAGDNKQIWGDQFNRPFAQVINVQQEIAQIVSEKLRARLSGPQEQQLLKKGTENPQAYELLLKGKFYSEKPGVESRKQANQLFQQAVATDPAYALAWADLARTYQGLGGTSVMDPKEALPKANAAAQRALELDPDLPDAHIAFARVLSDEWKWSAAEDEYKRALSLNPNFSNAHDAYSSHLSVLSRHDEAIAEITRARELNPLSVQTSSNYAYRLYFAKRYDESIAAARKTLELDANYDAAYLIMGYNYAAMGRYHEALDAYKKAVDLGDTSPSTMVYLGAAYAKLGERDKAFEILKELHSGKVYASGGELPVLLVALGDYDGAFASFEKAYAAHDLQLKFLNVDSSFDPIRNDPRFIDLVRRVGLPQ